MAEESDFKKQYNKLVSSNLYQQTLPSWRPRPTLPSTALTFFLFGIITTLFGYLLLTKSNEIVAISERYDEDSVCGTPWYDSMKEREVCNVTF